MEQESLPQYVGGVRVDPVTEDEVLNIIVRAVATRVLCRIHTLNVDHVVLAHRYPDFAAAIQTARVVVPDGMPLVWLLNKRGLGVSRITGVDLMERILRNYSFRVALLGGEAGVGDAVRQTAAEHGWCADIVSILAPQRADVVSIARSEALVGQIRGLNVDVLFVSFGAPLQEQWLYHHEKALNVPVLIGVGAAMDFLAGRIRRAPPFVRNHGLEWLYRMAQDPVRLGARYIGRDWRFVPLIWKYRKRPGPLILGLGVPERTVLLEGSSQHEEPAG
jgi:N-acetylglucosaminyldiphosphoundecaprenol N-acetyl-beta-D-mannosaminyltransferase